MHHKLTKVLILVVLLTSMLFSTALAQGEGEKSGNDGKNYSYLDSLTNKKASAEKAEADKAADKAAAEKAEADKAAADKAAAEKAEADKAAADKAAAEKAEADKAAADKAAAEKAEADKAAAEKAAAEKAEADKAAADKAAAEKAALKAAAEKAALKAAERKIAVAANGSTILNVYGVERVAVANPEIADVIVISGSEVMVVGKAPGATTLQVWGFNGRKSFWVEVSPDDVLVANEVKRILGLDDIKVSKAGKTIILEGRVGDKYQKLRAEKLASAYGEKVVNLLEITQPIQVKIEAKIIEISKNKSEELGIKWGNDPKLPGVFQFGQSPDPGKSITYSVLNPITGKIDTYSGEIWNSVVARNKFLSFGQQWKKFGGYYDINAQLTALIKNGAAKILSQPNLVTVSGENANILIGGQIPIPVSNQNGSITVEWKDYGIKLEILPEANTDGLINSKVKAAVSDVDWSSEHQVGIGANLKIPPVTTRQAETVIALSSGQTMAIGGLYASIDRKSITKLPFLGDLPILGALFTSKSFIKDETELIILVTPTIITAEEYLPKGQTAEMKSAISKAG